MSITGQLCRQAPLFTYHQIEENDTAEDLETWIQSLVGPGETPPTGGFVTDNLNGTFTIEGVVSVVYHVGHYILVPWHQAVGQIGYPISQETFDTYFQPVA